MKKTLLTIILLFNFLCFAEELVIGEERVEPGIVFIFEGAIKDHIMPMGMHLNEDQTHVHIEARVKWDENKKQVSKSIHQFGSATMNMGSPHYDDQINLFASEKLKDTFFN